MSLQNSSIVATQFVIAGFDTTKRPLATGVILLIIYVTLMAANVGNIVIIVSDQKMHKPMYILICNLAVVDILLTTSASPTILGVLLAGFKRIYYTPCVVQMLVYHWAAVSEMFSLALMAFDRLVAVCRPFQYHSYLTNTRTVILSFVVWIVSFFFVLYMPIVVTAHPLCSSRLKYIYCDFAAVIRATCANLSYYFTIVTVLAFFILFFTFAFICLSYFAILFMVKLSSGADKKKIGSTCLSHLICVTCYYVPLFVRIVLTRVGVVLTIEQWNGIMLGVTFGPGFVNPLVYCLNTKDIRQRLLRIFRHAVISKD